jgi:hypothetical protein
MALIYMNQLGFQLRKAPTKVVRSSLHKTGVKHRARKPQIIARLLAYQAQLCTKQLDTPLTAVTMGIHLDRFENENLIKYNSKGKRAYTFLPQKPKKINLWNLMQNTFEPALNHDIYDIQTAKVHFTTSFWGFINHACIFRKSV